VAGSSRSARVESLVAWTEYRFGVTAVNSAGEGGMAAVTDSGVCRTPPSAPQRSPRDVCTDSRRPHQLVIVWKVTDHLNLWAEALRFNPLTPTVAIWEHL